MPQDYSDNEDRIRRAISSWAIMEYYLRGDSKTNKPYSSMRLYNTLRIAGIDIRYDPEIPDNGAIAGGMVFLNWDEKELSHFVTEKVGEVLDEEEGYSDGGDAAVFKGA